MANIPAILLLSFLVAADRSPPDVAPTRRTGRSAVFFALGLSWADIA
jgi:hypothetical protein